jgi:serine/threonine-protein kinase
MATKIGPYNILRELGHGGMGVVYQATDSRDRRMVAIKMILVESSAELYRMALVREASATSKLQHPNIVSIYDIAQQKGQLYFVMEYLEGAPLDKLIRSKQPLSLPQKLNIVIQLCDALDYAHQHGVIHRDVKPANIFILRNGIVKLVDFGLAALLEVSNSKGRAGSIPYMSPEQVNATDIDGRSDVWSAGITLYELLVGKVPFMGTESQIFHHILYSPTPNLDPAFPEELNQRLAKALSKNKDERYQTAGAFGAALREIQHNLAKKGMPVPRLPQRLSRFQLYCSPLKLDTSVR